NFFVIGYGPGPRTSEAIFSLAAYARGLTLFFLQGKGLPDPAGLLRGSGDVGRSVRPETAKVLDRPGGQALSEGARAGAKVPLPRDGKHQLLIKAVSAKQRPRRAPAGG